jgi:hypothetical protein
MLRFQQRNANSTEMRRPSRKKVPRGRAGRGRYALVWDGRKSRARQSALYGCYYLEANRLISSTSSVNGTPSATGSTAITGLTIKVLGSTVTIPVNPTPNDVIFHVAGLTITLNQQIPDLSESAGITTNAIALDFNKFPFGTNAVNGSIDVAQSFASINVPEPSTWAMMLMGFVGLGYAGYRRARPAQRC